MQVRDGIVRLTPQDWLSLVQRETPPLEVAAVPGVPEAIAAAREPVLRLQLDVAEEDRSSRHHAWIDHEAVALLAQVSEDEHQLMAMPPSFLAGGLARLTGLGPRKVGDRQRRAADEELLDDLFHDDRLRRCSAYRLLGVRRAWMLATSGGETPLRLAVVEDAHGQWQVEPHDRGGWELVPTTATALWRLLTTMVIAATEPAP